MIYIKKYLVKKCNRLNLWIILEIPTFIDKSIYYDKELSSYCSIKTGSQIAPHKTNIVAKDFPEGQKHMWL